MSIPETLNHYRILGSLGQGGMGEVYAAEDTRLHRKVAVKVLPRLMAADPERRQRFEREAQAVAALNHPNIVTIHSVEESDGVPFLTMELVEGKPLGELSAGGALPVETLLRLGIGVSDAMAAAHQRGITHRDLKPANIMVTPDGRVKVLDFGLAKLREVQTEVGANDVTKMPTQDLTGEGRIIGTVAYMSPEQAEGKPVDQRSDIFSLGVVLHELATGQKPFRGDTNVSVISSILKDTPSLITDINPALPSGLARVIRRSLSKDPTRRYQTATDLRNELEELKQEFDSGVLSSSGVARSAVPPPSGGILNKIAIACSLILVLAAAGLGYALWKNRGTAAAGGVLEVDRLSRLTATGNASLAAISPDGRYVAHVKNELGADPALWMRQTATTSDVQIVAPAALRYDGVTYSPDGDYVYYVAYPRTGGVATLYRVAALGGTPQRILEDVDSRISFSPDRSRFTFTRGAPSKGTAWVMVANADGTGERQLAELAQPDQFLLFGPAWSPDGRTILAPAQSGRDASYAFVVAIDVASGATTALEGRWNFMGDLEWLPDGRSFLAAAAEEGPTSQQLWQVTYPGNERRRLTNDLNTYLSMSVTADATALVAVQAETVANLWVAPADDPGGGVQITRGKSVFAGQGGVDWTRDDRILYGSIASGPPQIWATGADGGSPAQLTAHDDPSLLPRGSPDGRYIVFQRFNAGRTNIWRMDADGANQTALTSGAFDSLPIPAADGFVYFTRIVAGGPRPFKVPIEGGEPVSLGDHHYRPIAISKDGTQMVGVGWDQTNRRSAVGIMPVSGGIPYLPPDLPSFGGTWAPDGKGIMFWSAASGTPGLFRYDLATKRSTRVGTIPDTLFAAAWSPDGKRMVLVRGSASSDVVLVTLKRAQ